MKSGIRKFRPAARLLKTIGEDLIKDDLAAIVELVKNSYDADSADVEVVLTCKKQNDEYTVITTVKDHGHGMSYDTVVDKWLVPATSDKLVRKVSPRGRTLQGRKGIGRYASAILGEELFLDTVDEEGNNTKIYIDWEEFESKEFLEDIEILVETQHVSKRSGTSIKITKTYSGVEEVRDSWTIKKVEKLLLELRKLISPFDNKTDDPFAISVRFDNFIVNNYENTSVYIEPFPLVQLYDYRISGTINKAGVALLEFENNCIKSVMPEQISLKMGLSEEASFCGDIFIDFRVYDKDPASIEELIARGLKDPHTGKYLGKREAKKLLDEFAGVGVYRGDFRIRPYGDSHYDWLELNRQRVQNPSLKVGIDQIIGFIQIKQEEESGLKEKSARDGLVENKAYAGLQEISKEVLKQLEARRFKFRQQTKRGRKKTKIDDELNNIFAYDKVAKEISNKLVKTSLTSTEKDEILSVLRRSSEEKTEALKEIKETIAMYQGQATLGKIVMVLLHEGRKPISYLKEQLPRISRWMKQYTSDPNNIEIQSKIESRIESSVDNVKMLSRLFTKLEPLSVTRAPKTKRLNLKSSIDSAFHIFEGECKRKRIVFINNMPSEIFINARENDVYTTFANLLENSIYWLSQTKVDNKEILVDGDYDSDSVIIDFCDNGPGINTSYIEGDLIFEPGFSLKNEGTGLGLALVGEALHRNNGKIYALPNNKGAQFRISFPNEGDIQ